MANRGCRSPLPSQEHKNKGYFEKKSAVLNPNVTQSVQKAYIITNKVQKHFLKAIFV